MFLLWGPGLNGKSTLTLTVRKVMGEYGARVNTDLFVRKDRGSTGPKESLANLRGKRYVVASELEGGRKLDVTLVKDLTGGESITADRKYEHEFEYLPMNKLWLVGNHKPVITDTTLSIWRRVKLMPFTVTIPYDEIDPDLPSKLEVELPGILAWAVKGCLDWQRYGLKEPNVVTTATTSYRHEQDILSDFIDDCCILVASASMSKADLKAEYQQWCEDNNVEPVKQHTFKARLTEKGIGEGRSSDGKTRIWHGIRLRTENDPTDISDKTRRDFSESPIREENKKTLWKKQSEVVRNVSDNDTPDYPSQPCHDCGCGDYWLTDWNEWQCSRCHPKPEGSNGK